MTDVTVWSRVLANTELSAWAACKEVQGEKVVDWDTAILNVTGLQAGLKYIFHFLLEMGNVIFVGQKCNPLKIASSLAEGGGGGERGDLCRDHQSRPTDGI